MASNLPYGFAIDGNGNSVVMGTLDVGQLGATTISPGMITTSALNDAKRLRSSTLEDIKNMRDEAYVVWQESEDDSDEAYGRYTALKEVIEILENDK